MASWARSARWIPRLVATDLDGTLLRSDGSVSERTAAALATVEAAGATLVLASGRPPRWIRPLAGSLGHRGLAVCSNGALVYDLARQRVVEEFALAPEIGRALLDRIKDAIAGVSFAVERDDTLFCEPDYAAVQLGHDPERVIARDIETLLAGDSVKLLARHATHDADTLLAKAREVVGDLADVTHSAGAGLVEISAKGVSKASSLALLCERLGIDAVDVAAFGDMPNDLPMLAWAGRAYAPTNAHPDVHAIVDQRCASNDEDGVASVLEELFA